MDRFRRSHREFSPYLKTSQWPAGFIYSTHTIEMAVNCAAYTSSNAFVASPNFGRRTFILSIIER